MTTIFFMTIIIFFATICFAKHNEDVCHGGVEKYNKGFTIAQKNGQFLRILGPVYGTVKIDGITEFPMKLSKQLNATITAQLTKEIYTLLGSGKIYYERQLLLEYDEGKDLCMQRNPLCPFRRCAINKKSFIFDLRDAGFLPGLYSGKLHFYSYDEKYVKYHVLGLEFKIKFIE